MKISKEMEKQLEESIQKISDGFHHLEEDPPNLKIKAAFILGTHYTGIKIVIEDYPELRSLVERLTEVYLGSDFASFEIRMFERLNI